MRDVDEARHADARGDLGDAPSSLDVNVIKSKVSFAHGLPGQCERDRQRKDMLGLIIAANEVVHDIRMSDALSNLLLVSDIPFLPNQRPCGQNVGTKGGAEFGRKDAQGRRFVRGRP